MQMKGYTGGVAYSGSSSTSRRQGKLSIKPTESESDGTLSGIVELDEEQAAELEACLTKSYEQSPPMKKADEFLKKLRQRR